MELYCWQSSWKLACLLSRSALQAQLPDRRKLLLQRSGPSLCRGRHTRTFLPGMGMVLLDFVSQAAYLAQNSSSQRKH